MTFPKVSVILSSYNHAKYLRESIESILNQTFKNFELIIVDDASTDQSWDIISEYTDNRILSIRNDTNLHGAYLRAIIFDVAKGDYIAIHHSDDICEVDKLEQQVLFLDENENVGAVFSDVLVVGENGDVLEGNSHPYQTLFAQPNRDRHEWLNHFFYKGNALCHPSILIRKKCYSDCGPYRSGLAQAPDFDMWVRLCMKYDIHVLPEKLLRLRIRENEANFSGNRPEVRIRAQFEYLQILRNYENITNPDELKKIFPLTEKYIRSDGFDPSFMLAMAALDVPETYNVIKLFGLELLFELLNDPKREKQIEHIYEFTHRDFIQLTEKYDVFSVELIRQLNANLAEKDLFINDFINSKAYKLITVYQKIKSKFLRR